jgi:hypothetical protein
MKAKAYNAAFFNSASNSFLILKKLKGKEFALLFLRKLMEKGLGEAYAKMKAKKTRGF